MQTEKKKFKKKKRMKLPPGFGSITTLSNPESRRKPYWAKKTNGYDEKGHPIYDSLGYFETWEAAFEVLYEYNKDPYDLKRNNLTFEDVYHMWYEHKFVKTKKEYSSNTINCYRAGFRNSSALHRKKFKDVKTLEMQQVIDSCELKHASLEHIKNLFNAMFKYALQYDIVEKNYARYVQINIEDDDESGVPFSKEDLQKLWQYKDSQNVDTILILIYSGWRVSEFLSLSRDTVDLENMTMTAGVKTRSGKNRVVPIHPYISDFIVERLRTNYYITPGQTENRSLTPQKYRIQFKETLSNIGISAEYTPHDCRHTFATLLSDAHAEELARKLMIGHKVKDLTNRVYTHKDIEYLRKELLKIK